MSDLLSQNPTHIADPLGVILKDIRKMKSFFKKYFCFLYKSRRFVYICFLCVTGQFVAVAQNIDSLRQTLAKTKDPITKIEISAQLAAIYQQQKNDSAFKTTIQQALELSYQTKNDTVIASVYSMIGSFYENSNNYNSSYEYYLKALNILEKMNYQVGICYVSESIAVVFKQLKNLKESINYLNKAKAYIDLPEIKQSYLPRGIYANLSEVYLQLAHQPDSALVYIQKANEVVDKKNDQFGYARILLDFGLVYSTKGDKDLAEVYFKKAISYSDSTNDKINYTESLKEYANYLAKNNQLQSAKQYALKAFDIDKKAFGGGIIGFEAAAIASNILGKLKQYDSAFYFSNVKDSLKEHLFGNDKMNAIQDAAFKQKIFETEEVARKNKEEQDRKNTLQYFLIAVCLVTFLITITLFTHSIFFNSSLIKFFGAIALLFVFEFINLLLHPFLEKITHHSPILIFTILVAIAALLIPLHHKMEKYVIDKLIQRNKAIRQKAALRILKENPVDEKYERPT